jgi:hypothetical protein
VPFAGLYHELKSAPETIAKSPALVTAEVVAFVEM